MDRLRIQGNYNFKNQSERLVYLGKHSYGGESGYWHQFAKADKPGTVWAELRERDLDMVEETLEP